MSDYHSIIAQAVSKLPTNTFEARQELYDHARATLARQLEQDPARIRPERQALEKAIRQVETLNMKQFSRIPASTALLIASRWWMCRGTRRRLVMTPRATRWPVTSIVFI
jgi:hypothetical protein